MITHHLGLRTSSPCGKAEKKLKSRQKAVKGKNIIKYKEKKVTLPPQKKQTKREKETSAFLKKNLVNKSTIKMSP